MTWTVEIYEGNQTLRRLMSESLTDAGMSIVERDADSEIPDELADLLIVDVDSGLPETKERAEAYETDERPVVIVGVRTSRERFPGVDWLDRPFARSNFVAQCKALLGVEDEPESDDDDEDDSVDRDGPITRELEFDEAAELEGELGLESGVLTGDSDHSQDEVIAIEDHGSIIVDISDLVSSESGGRLVSPIAKRELDTSELQRERIDHHLSVATRSPTFNQTMPDTPLAIEESEDPHKESTEDLGKGTTTEPTFVPKGSDVSDEFVPLFKSVSRMLADNWNRIGLAARSVDRADRIEAIINAAIEGGIRTAADEVQRIPGGYGFGGSLESLTVIELLRTARDRKLRGRLELDVPDGTFAIYMDGIFMEGIDMLSGSEDLVVLDMLLRLGKLDEAQYSELVQGYATGQFTQPATMKLLRDGTVTDADILEARQTATQETLRRLVMSRRGTFAFMDIRPGDGQPWPRAGLHIHVDEMLLQILREASVDTGDSQATARTKLVADLARATSMDSKALNEDERELLGFFKGSETLGEAREQFGDVDKVVDRLKKLELLKRSDPMINIPAEVRALEGAESTVVSPVPDALSRKEKAQDQDDNMATTHMKSQFDIGPATDNLDSDEVDALLEEALSEVNFDEPSESED